MAIQAQYPFNAYRVLDRVYEEDENQNANLLKGCMNYSAQQIVSNPESELTCNVSGSRKRHRADEMPLSQQQQQQISAEEIRFNECSGTSTSGRSAAAVTDLDSCFYLQNREIDALIKLQKEKLRLGMEEMRKRHYRSLLSNLEQQILKRMGEKETELNNERRRNAELEEKVKQMSVEMKFWFDVARNNEAIVSKLRARIDQIQEGCGDSDDDAVSCCYGGCDEMEKMGKESRKMEERRTCKVCREKDVSVLLLPCRHVCICEECELKLDSCPICNSRKSASMQIFLS